MSSWPAASEPLLAQEPAVDAQTVPRHPRHRQIVYPPHLRALCKNRPAGNFLVVTNARYKDLVLQHIPEIGAKQVLCEPSAATRPPASLMQPIRCAGRSRREDDRHPVGSPDPQRGRFPRDHRRVPRFRRPARRTDDRGHQAHTPRYGLRLHPGFGRPDHQQGQVLHRKARPRAGADLPPDRRISTGTRASSSGRCRPSSRPSAPTCPSTTPCSA